MRELTIAEYRAIVRQVDGEPEAAEQLDDDGSGEDETGLFRRPPPNLRPT